MSPNDISIGPLIIYCGPKKFAVVDIALNFEKAKFEISLSANNIFNAEYTETNLVPMPKGNLLLGVKYKFE